MRVIYNPGMDPTWNLAAEEWLLMHTHEDIFMLWRNARSVIVGRNQNTLAEINLNYVRQHNIPVVRRLTGGGAVFHDPGNLNFTYISRYAGSCGLDFHRFATPVITALQSMGVPCSFNGRNDIIADGKKISGNAQYISGNRVLHHGTLLFSSQLEDMANALRPNTAKFSGKAVKSVRTRVGNIINMLPNPMPIEEFSTTLLQQMAKDQPIEELSSEEKEKIENLATKYRSWEWNYGHSPRYDIRRITRTAGGTIDVHITVRHGLIVGVRLYGDYFGIRDVAELEAALLGCHHEVQALADLLAKLPLSEYMQGMHASTLAACMV